MSVTISITDSNGTVIGLKEIRLKKDSHIDLVEVDMRVFSAQAMNAVSNSVALARYCECDECGVLVHVDDLIEETRNGRPYIICPECKEQINRITGK